MIAQIYLELFGNDLEKQCDKPSRHSDITIAMRNRLELLKNFEDTNGEKERQGLI